MEWICFWELTGLEKAGMVGIFAIGLLFLALGLILAFRPGLWTGTRTDVGTEKYKFGAPAPLFCMVIGCAVLGVGVWRLWKAFPAENISFSQKPWTLGEIKERLERDSKVRVDLKGEAASFKIDKNFSGACASDLLTSICEYYPSKLQCEHASAGPFIIALRP